MAEAGLGAAIPCHPGESRMGQRIGLFPESKRKPEDKRQSAMNPDKRKHGPLLNVIL
jgi:hypothetical protein